MADKFAQIEAPPLKDQVIEIRSGRFTPSWRNWWTRFPFTLSALPIRLNSVKLTAQSAAISTTDFSGYSLQAGVYRASYYTRITQAAGVSSSLTVTISWTDGGLTQSYSGAAITGNTTTTNQFGTVVFRADSTSSATYETAYSSTSGFGGNDMEYSLDLILEKLKTP